MSGKNPRGGESAANAVAIAMTCLLAACAATRSEPTARAKSVAMSKTAALPLAVPNDNRTPAGAVRDGVVELHLEAREVVWHPEDASGPLVPALAFAEVGAPARIPGPLMRVAQGSEVRITIRNSVPESAHLGLPPPRQRRVGESSVAGAELTVHGLRAGTVEDDTLHVPAGAVREVRFRAERPGTFLYWGAMSRRPIEVRTGTDSQLTGAIVVDPAGAPPDPRERIFVITMTDAFPDPSKTSPGEDIFELAINGRSWPHTERLRYAVSEVVRWRWLNGTFSEHPMHLHGFHFRTLGRGDGARETLYPPERTQLAVTELMEPGGTLRMEWTPTRPGNWLMHCHLVDHITPAPARDAAMQAHDLHDPTHHALTAMAGLVMGITVADPDNVDPELAAEPDLRLVAKEQRVPGSDAITRGFVVQRPATPSPGGPVVPGPPLVLTRGETVDIEVVNEISQPTTVHWHGMELDSYYDGVAGWSRTGSRVAPLIAPGGSFVVRMTPPRAGTFIYHTHMDETDQLRGGMYGPLLVLEPGEVFDPESDRIFVLGGAVHDGAYHHLTVNGELEPAPHTLRVGERYRLRFVNITTEATVEVALTREGVPLRWTPLANDGAELPPALRQPQVAKLRFSAGQTYDFHWTPTGAGTATLLVEWPFPTEPGSLLLRQELRVREGGGGR